MTDQAAPTTPTAPPSPAAAAPSPSTPAAAPLAESSLTPTTASRPEGLPEQYWDTTANAPKWTDLTKELGDLSAFKASADERAKAVPAKPEDYKLELAPDYKPPDGITWAWDDKDPRLPQIRALAKEAGLDQGQFSRLVTAHVQHEIAQKQAYETAKTAQNKLLGANAAARIDAAKSALTPILGGKAAADAFMQSMVMASDVEAVEKLLRTISNPSGTTFTQNGREPPTPPQPPQETRWYPQMQQKAS